MKIASVEQVEVDNNMELSITELSLNNRWMEFEESQSPDSCQTLS